MRIILGSASRNRKYILKKLGYRFSILTADIDEKKIRFSDPKKLVKALSLAKAKAIIEKAPKKGILVTFDQITLCRGKILEKARNMKEAEEFIRSLSGQKVQNITGVTVTNLENGKQKSGVDVTTIALKEFDEAQVKKALKEKYVLAYGGAAALGRPIWKNYIKKVTGDPTALFGLSVELMEKYIKLVSNERAKKFAAKNR